MTPVLITGAGGQVGRELARAEWEPSIQPLPLRSDQLDITDRAAVLAAVLDVRPRVIVNAAAYTDVDGAESDPDRATAVNAEAVAWLAEAADAVDALLVHLSTDYVFDGATPGWYVEDDDCRPLSTYGRSKLGGERAADRATKTVVLRTSGVYSAHRPNFVATMLRLAREGADIGVVADQLVCPTAAADLAAAIVAVVAASEAGAASLPSRLYHAASPQAASWHELAEAVFEASTSDFDRRCRPLATGEYPTRADRPADGRLDSGRLADELGIRLPPWPRSLPSVVAELERGTHRRGPVGARVR